MKVLFVCTGNTCRSPMAAALFNAYARKRGFYRATSAGISAQEGETSEYALEALRRAGLRPKKKKSIQVDEAMLGSVDVTVTMTRTQQDVLRVMRPDLSNIYSIYDIAGEDIPDPYGEGKEEYFICCYVLKELMPQIYDFIKKRT